tara:strand:- start:312 stop:875 length:564 start_codon:yes stop_codon:yes gene_type:complete
MAEEHYRIAIVGTYCSGKSTLANCISQEYRLPLSGDALEIELGELFPEKRFDELTSQEALLVCARGLRRRQKIESNGGSFISDASTISELAYYLSARETIFNDPLDFPSLVKNYSAHSQIYTHVLYLPLEIEFEQNKHRPNNPELRSAIDRKIPEVIRSREIPFTTISGSLPERMKAVASIFNPLSR